MNSQNDLINEYLNLVSAVKSHVEEQIELGFRDLPLPEGSRNSKDGSSSGQLDALTAYKSSLREQEQSSFRLRQRECPPGICGRSPGSGRRSTGTAIRRPGRAKADTDNRGNWAVKTGRLHCQRPEMPSSRQPEPFAR